MNRVFADSSYFFAVLIPKDSAHRKARDYALQHHEPIVTAVWVLTELADGLAATDKRRAFSQLIARLREDPENELVPLTQELMDRGIQLYDSRQDKKWSLTDCISFVVMQDRGITEALTGDQHFEQAGFAALLK